MKTLILTTLTLILTIGANAKTVYSVASGNWENGSTWTNGTVPMAGDLIVIDQGFTVRVNINNMTLSSDSVDLIVMGQLVFPGSGDKLHLGCGSSINVTGSGSIVGYGGGGASNQITVCGSEVWRKSDGPAYAPFSVGATVVLPVEMLSVEVSRDENNNVLSWVTASETNNDGFIIKRSEDGTNFETIGSVRGAGNSSVTREYSYKDNAAKSGVSYYMIEQVDMNGSITQYGPYKMEVTETVELNVYPNPTTDYVNVTSNTSDITSVKIFDISGKQIQTPVNYLATGQQIQVSELIPGTYMVYVETTNGSPVMKQLIVGR